LKSFGLRKHYIRYSELLVFLLFPSPGILENRKHDVSIKRGRGGHLLSR
jgi:hypothetical protein